MALAAFLGTVISITGCSTGRAGTRGVSSISPAIYSVNAPGGPGSPADPDTLTLALKFVQLLDDENSTPALSREAASRLTSSINTLYAQCGIRFRLEEYLPVVAGTRGLRYHTSSMSELDSIRDQFSTPNRLIVINTGSWNHGSMGQANAWTTMPGQKPSGAVIEGPVADFAGIVAHELGHYLSLGHTSDPTDLMNPIIYGTSTKLLPSECSAMRKTAQTVWADMLRPNA